MCYHIIQLTACLEKNIFSKRPAPTRTCRKKYNFHRKRKLSSCKSCRQNKNKASIFMRHSDTSTSLRMRPSVWGLTVWIFLCCRHYIYRDTQTMFCVRRRKMTMSITARWSLCWPLAKHGAGETIDRFRKQDWAETQVNAMHVSMRNQVCGGWTGQEIIIRSPSPILLQITPANTAPGQSHCNKYQWITRPWFHHSSQTNAAAHYWK